MGALVAQLVKNLPAMWETWVQSLGWEDPPEKETTTHSRILAWRIPVHGVANSQTRLSDFHFTFTFVDLQYIFIFLKFQKKHVYDNRFKQHWQAYGKVNVIDFYFLAQVYSKGFRIYLSKYMPYLYKYICRYLFTQHCITFFTMTCNFPFSCVFFFEGGGCV